MGWFNDWEPGNVQVKALDRRETKDKILDGLAYFLAGLMGTLFTIFILAISVPTHGMPLVVIMCAFAFVFILVRLIG